MNKKVMEKISEIAEEIQKAKGPVKIGLWQKVKRLTKQLKIKCK